MEQTFQTSFIPKKPIIETEKKNNRPISFLLIVSIFLFVVMVLVFGGAFFYKESLAKNITKMKNDLLLAKNRFEPEKISQMKILDKRLDASGEVLSRHVAISPILSALEEVTLKTVRYTEFSYTLSENGTQKIEVKMKGQSVDYNSIALQGELFSENKNLVDPVFSNLALDDKGSVSFDLAFSVDLDFVDYRRLSKIENENSSINNVIDNIPTPN